MNRCLERARDGEPAAVGYLVEVLSPRIRKMAAYYARCSGEDAEDLAQEAWLALLEVLPGLDLDIGQPEQFLIAHARWRILDTIKHERLRRCISLDDELTDCLRHAPDEMISSALTSEFTGRLKSTQRSVLRCLLAGLTWREAGEQLGCASANIAYHVRQIRKLYEEWA